MSQNIENKIVVRRLDELKGARTVFIQTLFLNLLVAVSKLVCGFLTNTLSMVADGFHSMLDSLSNVIGICGITISLKPPDEGHPYGHQKFEALAAIAISFMMFLACTHVLSDVIERLTSKSESVPDVTVISYVVMGLSLAINVLVTWYERKKSRELQSTLLEADAAHTLSDVFVSLGVVVALIAAQFNFYMVDILASIFIIFAIFKAGYEIVKTHIGSLVDAAMLDKSEVESIVLSVPKVVSCHKIRTRGMKDHIFLDLHVQVPGELNVIESHKIATAVEEKLKSHSYGIVDVVVHIEEAHEQRD